jgi:hypothetical protein
MNKGNGKPNFTESVSQVMRCSDTKTATLLNRGFYPTSYASRGTQNLLINYSFILNSLFILSDRNYQLILKEVYKRPSPRGRRRELIGLWKRQQREIKTSHLWCEKLDLVTSIYVRVLKSILPSPLIPSPASPQPQRWPSCNVQLVHPRFLAPDLLLHCRVIRY